MLSVLIIDNKVFDHYSKYDYFLDHFENNANIEVCLWNKDCVDEDVSVIVPQLMDKVRNVSEWNAYIICDVHKSMDYLKSDFDNKTQFSINPYERANHEGYNTESDGLLKLLYLLGGRGDDRVEYIEQSMFRAARPIGIYLITPRILKSIEQQKLFLLSELRKESHGVLDDPNNVLAGKVDVTKRYSEFWGRYEYPSNCRFLVYDFPDVNHQTYQNSWFTFWISVISLTQNHISSSVLAPYKLHILNIEIDDDSFAEYINEFYTMLLENKEINDIEIEKESEFVKKEENSTDITVEREQEPVFVTFPNFNVDNLFATTENIGVFKERPVMDELDWIGQMKRTKEAIGDFFKALIRGKNEAVSFVHASFVERLPSLKDKRITKYDAEELEEAIEHDELFMVELDPGVKASREAFHKRQKKASEIVTMFMSHRLTYRVGWALIVACMLICFGGFIPYMINSLKHSVPSFLIALLVSAGALSIAFVCGFMALFKLKKQMKRLIKEYNNVILDCYEKAKLGSEVQSEYLTYMLDYMKKYQLIDNAKTESVHSKRVSELTLANIVFDDAIAECAELAALRSISMRRITDRFVKNTIEITPETRVCLYKENKNGKMALNSSPDVLWAPFSFTSALSLFVEELYESDKYAESKEVE